MREPLDEARVGSAYRLFYGEGLSLGEVAKRLGCGIYDLSPWLGAPAVAIAGQAIMDERARTETLRKATRAFVEAYDDRYAYGPNSPRCGYRATAPLREEAKALSEAVASDRVWDR